jgi:hypothetical protein
MLNNIPSITPGTKIIVRHCANGDTEFICRADDPLAVGVFRNSRFGGIFWMLIFVAAFWLCIENCNNGTYSSKRATKPEVGVAYDP